MPWKVYFLVLSHQISAVYGYLGAYYTPYNQTYNSLFFHLKLYIGYCVWKSFVGFRIDFSCRVEVSSLMKTPFCRQHNSKLNFVFVIVSNFITFTPKVDTLLQFMILKFCSFQLNLYIKKQLSCRGWYMKNAKSRKYLFSKMFRH